MPIRHLFLFPILALSLACSATPGYAADNWYELPVRQALENAPGADKLHSEIKVFMKGEEHPAVARKIGEYKSNKRTNALKKTKETACGIAFLSAIIALQERAINEGGDAVIDIYSLTKSRKYESAEKYNCLAGTMIANVVLKGTVVELR